MTYSSGSFTTATPATDLAAALKTVIDAHAAWVFVETVTGTPSTRVTDVYKCLGSVNSFGTDFYVGITHIAETAIGFILGETYNSSTKKFGKGAIRCLYNTTLVTGSDFSYGTDRHVADETTLVATTDGFLKTPGPGGGIAGGTLTVSALVSWWLSVTNDRIVMGYGIGSTVSTQRAYYIGLYESFHPTSVDPFPLANLCLDTVLGFDYFNNISVQNGGGSATRDTVQSASLLGAMSIAMSCHPWTWDRCNQNRYENVSREPISGKWWTSRIPIIQTNRAGGTRGLLKDVVRTTMLEMTEAHGDVMVVDGVSYTCFSPGMGGSEVLINNAGSGAATGQQFSIWVSQAV